MNHAQTWGAEDKTQRRTLEYFSRRQLPYALYASDSLLPSATLKNKDLFQCRNITTEILVGRKKLIGHARRKQGFII